MTRHNPVIGVAVSAPPLGESVEQIPKADQALEEKALVDLREGIAYCESVRDFVSRDLLLTLRESESNTSTFSNVMCCSTPALPPNKTADYQTDAGHAANLEFQQRARATLTRHP